VLRICKFEGWGKSRLLAPLFLLLLPLLLLPLVEAGAMTALWIAVAA
jgi:hypothetical protein